MQAKIPLTEFPALLVDYKKLVAFESKGVKDFPEVVGTGRYCPCQRVTERCRLREAAR